jgi:YesN/AraC family two-component response regulator
MNILIVDDEEMILDTFQEYLLTFDHNVDIANSGKEALSFIQNSLHSQEKYDIVISDIHMPEMTGVEVFHLVKEQGFSGKYVLITGYYTEFSEDELLHIGVDRVLNKPIELIKLSEIITELVEN